MSPPLIMPCEYCGGDGGFSEPWKMDPFTGAIYEREWECRDCDGTGEYEVEPEPAEDIEDLDERCGVTP